MTNKNRPNRYEFTADRLTRAMESNLENELRLILGYFLSAAVVLGLIFTVLFSVTANANSATPRLKDIVTFEGIRENLLVGYGLVVGLNGTGDKLNNSAFTEKSLQSFLDRLGVSTINEELKVKNVAAVTVTTKLPAFARAGSKIDITVSTMGDATSLQGGTLVATPLMGADGEMYAVAQGPITISGYSAGDASASVTKGVPTTGFVSNGAIVEREVPFELNDLSEIKISVNNPDLSTAKAIEAKINEKLGDTYARATDPGTISLDIPLEYTKSVASLLAEIEGLTVETDQPAKIVIDEASGTIVMNENVKVDTIALAQGNLVVTITKTPLVSQPGILAPEGSETIVTETSDVNVEEGEGNIAFVNQNANLQDLVNALNSLGVSTQDLITILQTIQHAGALNAEIVSR
jgi:flagellar P-ring protein precursor FlgI